MPPVPKPKRARRPNFLRQWRQYRRLSLASVGAEIGMNGTNLGRIEKGEVPYAQDLLEQLADLYGCEIADLLMRDPGDPEGMWSLWDRAQPAVRNRIVSVAKALLDEAGDPTSREQQPNSTAPAPRQVKRRSA